MRNKEMTIFKALGIIFVVMGYRYGPFSWFPIYSFHMALFFYYLGFYYKKNESVGIFNSIGIISAAVINIVMINKFKDIQYYLVWGDFKGHLFMPFVSSITAIYTYLLIAKALSKILKENDILYKIGENTLSIMFNHIFIFFLINYAALKLTHGDIKQLKDIWFAYKIGFYWPVYVMLGVLIPVLLAEGLKKFRRFITQKIDFRKMQENNL